MHERAWTISGVGLIRCLVSASYWLSSPLIIHATQLSALQIIRVNTFTTAAEAFAHRSCA